MAVPSANLQAALDAVGARPLWFFEAKLPDRTRRYGQAAVGSVGLFEEKVVNWGSVHEQISDPKSGNVDIPSFQLRVADPDRDFSSLTESADAEAIKYSAGTLYLAAPGVAQVDWLEHFRGRLSSWSLENGVATLTYRQESGPLLTQFPDSGWRIGLAFPFAPAKVRNEIAPLCYGIHNSAAYTNRGFMPAILVDPTGNKRHLVSAGRVKAVPAVWKNGTQQTVTTHYMIQYREIAGRGYTLIEWTAAGKPADDDEITCDVQGIEDVGDGSGSVIENPAEQLEHALTNFAFKRHPGLGDWYSSDDQVDATSFAAAATFFSARGYEHARLISEAVALEELLAEWARCHEARVFWSFPGAGQSGKVAVGVEDPSLTDLNSEEWQQAYVIDGQPLAIADDDRLNVDGYSVEAVYDDSTGKYVQAYSVTDLSVVTPAEESFKVRWGPKK